MVLGLLCNITAGDLLAFIGAILGAAATIVAVFLTIKSEGKKHKIAAKNAVKPWLTLEIVDGKYGQTELVFDVIENDISTLKYVVLYYNGEEWVFNFSLVKAPLNLLKSEEKSGAFYFDIKNVGANTATNLFLVVTDNNGKSSSLYLSALAVNGTKGIIMIQAPKKEINSNNITLSFIYTDILNEAAYRQDVKIDIAKNTKLRIDLSSALSAPYSINKSEIDNLKKK